MKWSELGVKAQYKSQKSNKFKGLSTVATFISFAIYPGLSHNIQDHTTSIPIFLKCIQVHKNTNLTIHIWLILMTLLYNFIFSSHKVKGYEFVDLCKSPDLM